jgi:hypothetical protein
MIKAAVTIASAAVLAGFLTVMPGMNVEAGTPKAEIAPKVETMTEKPAALRLDPRTAGCAQRAWPYYEKDCLSGGEPRQVRRISLDRLN